MSKKIICGLCGESIDRSDSSEGFGILTRKWYFDVHTDKPVLQTRNHYCSLCTMKIERFIRESKKGDKK